MAINFMKDVWKHQSNKEIKLNNKIDEIIRFFLAYNDSLKPVQDMV